MFQLDSLGSSHQDGVRNIGHLFWIMPGKDEKSDTCERRGEK